MAGDGGMALLVRGIVASQARSGRSVLLSVGLFQWTAGGGGSLVQHALVHVRAVFVAPSGRLRGVDHAQRAIEPGSFEDRSAQLERIIECIRQFVGPGGFVLLLGLPWGVLDGLMKLFLVGVSGRDEVWVSLVPPGNKLAMKPDIVVMVPNR
ncbi:hypothetical protein Ct61P_13935 [Colletotrichum tofieldiae]|nr:hypothetical protein Ct61P_13935 [Colletotrichum tofieldiae]